MLRACPLRCMEMSERRIVVCRKIPGADLIAAANRQRMFGFRGLPAGNKGVCDRHTARPRRDLRPRRGNLHTKRRVKGRHRL